MMQRWLATAIVLWCGYLPAQAASMVNLAQAGQAKLNIAHRPDADAVIVQAAQALAQKLGALGGCTFKVEPGNDAPGITLGLFAEHPQVTLPRAVDHADPFQREIYLLRSTPTGLYVLGATPLAVQHGVWDLLQRLGYRQFFPGETWEVLPPAGDLALSVDAFEVPDYHSRRIWYGYGTWPFNRPDYNDWCVKNRMVGGFGLNTGHAYDNIMHRNEAVFAAHPEYTALRKGERGGSKLCISNPQLRQLCIDFYRSELAKRPDLECISVEPSDGAGWCECEPCQALGSPSDRAVLLANTILEGLTDENPHLYAGMYAYAFHAQAPQRVKPHPRLIVSVATAFLQGRTTEGNLADWQAAGTQSFGIREYYDVNTWSRNLPGSARGTRPDYLADSIRKFHQLGARFMSAESGESWGPNGLGYYLASRCLWDVDEADRRAEIRQDFITRAFGAAAGPMARYYTLIDGGNRPRLSSDLLGRMYRDLQEGYQLAADQPAVLARLDHLLGYTRYVELYLAYAAAGGEARQAAFEEVIKHAYRIGRTQMIHSYAAYRDIDNRDKSVILAPDEKFNIPEDKNPLKVTTPFTREEWQGILQAGVAGNPLLAFTPRSYDEDFVPAKVNNPGNWPALLSAYATRGRARYYLWLDEPGPVKLKVTAGVIYTNHGPAEVELHAADNELLEPVATAQVDPDRAEHDVTLTSRYRGLHTLLVSDHGAGTKVWIDPLLPVAMDVSPEKSHSMSGRWAGYVYVPRGTQVIGGYYNTADGLMTNHDISVRQQFPRGKDYFSITVPAGSDDTLWQVQKLAGSLEFLNIPPLLFRDPTKVFLPSELVNSAPR